MIRVISKLEKISVKRNRLKICLFFLLSIILMENSWFGQQNLEHITNGLRMIDMNFFNSADQIFKYLGNLGIQGRRAYKLLLAMDYIMIASFGLLQCSLLLALLRRIKANDTWKLIVLLPVLRGFFDLIETTLMLINTSLFNLRIEVLLKIVSFSTSAKWIFLWVTLLAIGILLIVNVIKKIKGDK